jgi:hypothetical protein
LDNGLPAVALSSLASEGWIFALNAIERESDDHRA